MLGFLSNLFGSSQLSGLQEQTALAEQKVRLHRLTAEAKLLESWPGSYTGTAFGDFVDPSDALRNGDEMWQHAGTIWQQRKDGSNYPFVQNETELTRLRNTVRVLVETSSLAKGVLKQLLNFVVGDGYKYHAAAESDTDAPPELVAEVQAVIDEFTDANEWCELEQELFRRSRRDGEYFLRYFPDRDGATQVRVVEPEHVKQPPDTTFEEWGWGIRTDPEDIQTVLEYHVQTDSAKPGEFVPADEIQHVKVNVDRNIKRGMSDFYCCTESLDGVRKLLRNLREGAAIQAAIAGIWQYETAGSAAVGALVTDLRDKGRQYPNDPIKGRPTNYQKIEPGTFIHTPKGRVFLPPPMASQNALNHISTEQAVLRAVGAAWCMPEFMISGDASNNNYSSILVSGSPFVREIKTAQSFYKRRDLATMWTVIYYAHQAGRFKGYTYEEVMALVDVQCEAPTPEIANRLEEAQVKEIEHRNTVVSKQTWRQQSGYDNDQEVTNLHEEPPTVQQVAGFPSPGQGRPGILSLPEPGATIPAQPEAGTASQKADRTTVGALQAISALQTAYYAGDVPREAAVASAQIVFGFPPAEAAALFPEIPPVKLTPDDSPEVSVIATPKVGGQAQEGGRFFPG